MERNATRRWSRRQYSGSPPRHACCSELCSRPPEGDVPRGELRGPPASKGLLGVETGSSPRSIGVAGLRRLQTFALVPGVRPILVFVQSRLGALPGCDLRSYEARAGADAIPPLREPIIAPEKPLHPVASPEQCDHRRGVAACSHRSASASAPHPPSDPPWVRPNRNPALPSNEPVCRKKPGQLSTKAGIKGNRCRL
jgi:hypothetical protein